MLSAQRMRMTQSEAADRVSLSSFQQSTSEVGSSSTSECTPVSCARRSTALQRCGRIVVPNAPDLRSRIMYEYHDVPTAGHRGCE
ncbi:hypothetical protein PHMEG_00028124 [Phytophthora megakarya]|uniref:Reverse transcriptase n=1 Tax=Phytophthora megakarya TaxID=4795 RepID=A0A225V5M7_9STRA|nr:hypothetical protein PHMEG_00028124 [Phytophthora megakarya]